MSQNDLIAESMGSVIGTVIWLAAGRQMIDLARTITQGGQAGLASAFIAYSGLYVVYALMPLDFLVSAGELSGKLASDAIALTVAASCHPARMNIATPDSWIAGRCPAGLPR